MKTTMLLATLMGFQMADRHIDPVMVGCIFAVAVVVMVHMLFKHGVHQPDGTSGDHQIAFDRVLWLWQMYAYAISAHLEWINRMGESANAFNEKWKETHD